MPVHDRQTPPGGHGEVLYEPRLETWAALARENATAARSWPAGMRALREEARADAVAAARDYSSRIGVVLPRREAGDLIVMTGHQPELFHPGVWVKDFVVQRLSEELPALGIDIVVDTDAAGRVELTTPCLTPTVGVCRIPLVEAPGDAAYAQVPVPDASHRAAFREAAAAALATLPAPALGRHFAVFAEALEDASGRVDDLGSLLTAARRTYERPAGTDYLELPVSIQALTPAMRRFSAAILTDAERFRGIANAALAEYRQRTGTRSVAQPFPDLEFADGRTEVPFWLLRAGARVGLLVDEDRRLWAGDTGVVASLGRSAESAAKALDAEGLLVVPKALALTLFERLFVSDLFVHGTGGGRYDRVTDAIVRAYYGVEPPAFVVTSMTLLLPLGCPITTDAEVAALEHRLHRIEHNPDQVLGEVEFDTVGERVVAEDLAARKAALVAAISSPGANRKEIGLTIRDVNAELAALLSPLTEDVRSALGRVRSARDASAVLTDRTYPYCLWDPREVADKVR
ncbi:MAG: hypothetical protein Q7W44_04400 [Coriobacteriia bacterium]|nr:hypothetical protein [Coriobacteriia bacterium]